MRTRYSSPFSILVVVVFLVALVTGTAAAQPAGNPPTQLTIYSATLSADSTTLFVTGQNLGSSPSVTLNQTPLNGIVVSPDGTALTAYMTPLPPGSYLLVVTRGNSATARGTFTMTIGGDGPQGATGPQGPQGVPGVAGADGADGATGPTGPQGSTGLQGATGVQGPTGAQGPTGPQGPPGVDFFDGDWIVNGNNLQSAVTGNVGIGTAPTTRLDVAGTIRGDRLVYTSPRTHYVSVGGANFGPVISTTQFVKAFANGHAYVTVAGSTDQLWAPVSLPDGAVVTNVQAIVFDSDGTNDIRVQMMRQFTTGAYSIVFDQISSGAPGNQTLTQAVSHTVNNQTGAYSVRVIPTPAWPSPFNLAILSVTITYEITEAQ